MKEIALGFRLSAGFPISSNSVDGQLQVFNFASGLAYAHACACAQAHGVPSIIVCGNGRQSDRELHVRYENFALVSKFY